MQVKLVKCIIQNIVVDISFNQLGGLCTLCFLEKVACLIHILLLLSDSQCLPSTSSSYFFAGGSNDGLIDIENLA